MDYRLLGGIHNNSEGNETTFIDGQTNASEHGADNEKFAVQSGMSQSLFGLLKFISADQNRFFAI